MKDLVAVAGGWVPGGAGLRIGPLSLSVAPGACVAICGPSGCGKTSLLRALAALTRYAQGEVRYQGKSPAEWTVPQYRRRVYYLAQHASLGDSTVRSALQRPFQFTSAEDQVFNEGQALTWMADLSLSPDLLQRPAREVSAGEAQRINVIRALGMKPKILLADEPTSALDPKTSLAVEDLLLKALAEGIGIVLVSHDPEQRQRLAHQTIDLS